MYMSERASVEIRVCICVCMGIFIDMESPRYLGGYDPTTSTKSMSIFNSSTVTPQKKRNTLKKRDASLNFHFNPNHHLSFKSCQSPKY